VRSDYPHIQKSLDTITPISADTGHLPKCVLCAQFCCCRVVLQTPIAHSEGSPCQT
jgi:hypothetical protein